nr:uncharacterized protein LOC4342842 isoform X2 [Oryza sativa Japonica Group]
MNTRPVVLVFLLLVLVITSQFEWKQQIGDAAADPADARRRHQGLAKEDAVKEKARKILLVMTGRTNYHDLFMKKKAFFYWKHQGTLRPPIIRSGF